MYVYYRQFHTLPSTSLVSQDDVIISHGSHLIEHQVRRHRHVDALDLRPSLLIKVHMYCRYKTGLVTWLRTAKAASLGSQEPWMAHCAPL